MSATTTSRKRQLNEAQDTEQSTPAKEAKISKPDIQKVHASVPLNDVISSLEDHIRFTDDVMKKLRLVDKELSMTGRKNVQEVLEMNEKRNNRLKKELQDMKVQFGVVADNEDLQHTKYQKGKEKPKAKNILKRLPCEMICHIFRYLPDKDLFNQMLSDRFFEKSAGYVLQRRKCSLYSLRTKFGKETILKVKTTHGYYDLQVENASAICEGYEAQKGNNLTRAMYLLFTYYNCSAANVNSCNSDEIPLTLEAFFGPAPSEPCEKITIYRLDMTAHTAPLLGWLSPKNLFVRDSPNWLIETSQKELKELIAGIDRILFTWRYIGYVDKLMEACEAKHISIVGADVYWSDESILSVIKANADGHNNGIIRTIQMFRMGRANSHWKELFAPFTNSYEETGSGDYVGCRIVLSNTTAAMLR